MPGDTGGLAQFRGGTIAELIAFLNAVGRNRAIDFLKARSKWAPTDSLAERRTEESLVQSAETRSMSTRGSRMPHVGEDVFTIGHPKDYLWSFGQGVVSQIRPGLRVEVSRRDPSERDRDPDSS